LAIKLNQPEGVCRPNPERPGRKPASDPTEHWILHDAPPAQVRLVDQEARSRAELAWNGVLQQQDAGRQPAVLPNADLATHRRSELDLGGLD
jgi:hypothetical protein